jgi:hypothetical protein
MDMIRAPWAGPDEARRDSECLATSGEQQIPPLRCGMTTKKLRTTKELGNDDKRIVQLNKRSCR